MVFFFSFGLALGHVGSSVHLPGIEPTSSELEMWSLNHWTAREVLWTSILDDTFFFIACSQFCASKICPNLLILGGFTEVP